MRRFEIIKILKPKPFLKYPLIHIYFLYIKLEQRKQSFKRYFYKIREWI
jgi:hypothetical protein